MCSTLKGNPKRKHETFGKIYNNLHPTVLRPVNLYGLCKIHKTIAAGIPSFRLVFSAIVILIYTLVKFFIPLSEQLTYNYYTIKTPF